MSDDRDRLPPGWVDRHGFEHGNVDVFLSSSHADADRRAVIRLAELMIARGMSVFSSAATSEIPPGVDYQTMVRHYLERSTVILVCWSEHSTRSDWVNAEAEFGRSSGKLVACKLSACEPLPPFNTFQFEDLSSWSSERGQMSLARLLALLDQRIAHVTVPFDLSLKSSKRPAAAGWWSRLFRRTM
jgi:hypothetical protein